jgi:ferritin-like metal-binding protein YciE
VRSTARSTRRCATSRPTTYAYLADAHAIEAQAIELLSKGEDIAGDPELARLYAEHLEETRDQQALVRERLEALGGSPTPLKDAGMRVGALN